jgi:hypothetical protein
MQIFLNFSGVNQNIIASKNKTKNNCNCKITAQSSIEDETRMQSTHQNGKWQT